MEHDNKVICAVKIVLFLAISHQIVTVEEISKAIRIPELQVAAVLQLLYQADVLMKIGYVRSRYQLRGEAERLSLKDIVQIMSKSYESEKSNVLKRDVTV